MALNLYQKWEGQDPPKSHPDIEALSEVLNALPIHQDRTDVGRFRNPNGVRMKLMNFRRFDPAIESAGLSRGGQDEALVWNEFAGDPERLAAVAAAIAAGYESVGQDTLDEELEYSEGRVLYRLHRIRERDPKLVSTAKRRFRKKHGSLFCECCDFDFEARYGPLGDRYIEAHHIVPIHQMKEGTKVKSSDLAMVCANCHRMLHRAGPSVSVDELRNLTRTWPRSSAGS